VPPHILKSTVRRFYLTGLLMGVHCPMPPSVDNFINDGDEIKIGKLGVTVVHCPGHSPGHVAFFVATESTKPLLFCGDLIFEGSIGRTDFPGCDPHAMEKSLRRLKTFPRETTLFPGHRGLTSVGAELDTNPFL
jgi:hydroxyacylglutathione hydrolase